MPIEHMKSGSTIVTGDAIGFIRLCALKSAVKLELAGIKVRRGPVIWKMVKKEFRISGGKQGVYDWLCAKVEEERPKQEHRVTDENGREIREVGGQEVQ